MMNLINIYNPTRKYRANKEFHPAENFIFFYQKNINTLCYRKVRNILDPHYSSQPRDVAPGSNPKLNNDLSWYVASGYPYDMLDREGLLAMVCRTAHCRIYQVLPVIILLHFLCLAIIINDSSSIYLLEFVFKDLVGSKLILKCWSFLPQVSNNMRQGLGCGFQIESI